MGLGALGSPHSSLGLPACCGYRGGDGTPLYVYGGEAVKAHSCSPTSSPGSPLAGFFWLICRHAGCQSFNLERGLLPWPAPSGPCSDPSVVPHSASPAGCVQIHILPEEQLGTAVAQLCDEKLKQHFWLAA